MDIGESVSVVIDMQKQGKCVICDSDHGDPKREDVKKTAGKDGWKRVSMQGIFEETDTKKSIYKTYPPSYKTEGHHCVAFVHFVKSDKDVCLRLNHFLNKFGYSPNRDKNIIQLPGRVGPPVNDAGKTWPKGVKESYKSFWMSIDQEKPLQLHTGRHRGGYFTSSMNLVRKLLQFVSGKPDKCKDEDVDAFKQKLMKHIEYAENYAFQNVASASWKCHPEHIRIAKDLYDKPAGSANQYIYTSSRGAKSKKSEKGYGGNANISAPWPSLDELETGPY